MSDLSLRFDEAAYLAAHLRRLTGWDPRAAVRVQVAGRSLGVFGAPPIGCLSFIAVPLAEPLPESGLDRVVSAGRLRDVLGEVTPARWGEVRSFPVPDEIAPVAELAVLPPQGPWTPAERGIAGDVKPRVVESLGSSVSQVSSPGWGGVPMGALQVALGLGLLPHDGLKVETGTCEGWKRFVTPGGQVFVRTSSLPPKLTLAVSSTA